MGVSQCIDEVLPRCYGRIDFIPARWTVVSAISLGGCFFVRTLVLIDGQNLYHLARRAWASGLSSPYAWPSYDVEKLARILVSKTPGRTLAGTRFYTGVPDPAVGPSELFWHGFWSNKIRYMKSRGIYVYRGRVSPAGQEKGVDVSLALDLVRATYERQYEAAIIVSQDWDFGPAVRLAKEIAHAQDRRLAFESSFPVGPGSVSRRGVPGTIWVPIDQATYDKCRDPREYRPRRQ